ncbi:MAG TPA: IS66 family insertion sequence element accessory protein TnpB [Candidatus Tectomicrobia bacterium]
MLQLTPQSRIFVATQPVDFRKGIDGLAAVCRQGLGENPLEGAVYVFRNRAGTALKLLCYDGQGYWLMMKRLSQGRFTWWPTTLDARVPLSARELIIVLWNGNPEGAQMAQDWRRVA